jgi:hypothetical protein
MNWIKAFLVVVGRGILTALKYVFFATAFFIIVGAIAAIPIIEQICAVSLAVMFFALVVICVIGGIIVFCESVKE